MCDVKEGEDAFMRLGEALDYLDRQQLTPDIGAVAVKSEEQVKWMSVIIFTYNLLNSRMEHFFI